MLNRLRSHTILLVCALMLTACAGTPFETESDFDNTFLFHGLRSWSWISEHPMITSTPGVAQNPLLENRIMRLVEKEMSKKGYRLVADSSNAELVIAFTLGKRDQIKVNSYPVTYRGGYGYGGYGGWGTTYYGTQTHVRNYTEGTIAFDIFDGKTHRPVWHGRAFGNVKESRTQEERNELARQIVRAVFDRFPPS